MSKQSLYPMSVYGIKKLDAKLERMLKVKKVCDENGVSYPLEVTAYLGDSINSNTTESEIRENYEVNLDDHPAFTNCGTDDSSGVLVDLEKLPDDVVALKIFSEY